MGTPEQLSQKGISAEIRKTQRTSGKADSEALSLGILVQHVEGGEKEAVPR